MARARNWWRHGYTVALIWLSSFVIFFLGFQLAIRNSSQNDRSMDSVPPPTSNSDRRSKLYDKMEQDLDEHGTVFLQGGETSQSLSLSDIFALKDGMVTPVHKAANPPVRANVLYLSPEFSVPISQAVSGVFLPYFDKAIWFQNSSLYHFSMFHASHHIEAVPATEIEVETEANAVKAVAEKLCPLKIVLDRVVLTSTGVLLGCWQVTSGTDPVTIRAKLRNALPRAPEKQLYHVDGTHGVLPIDGGRLFCAPFEYAHQKRSHQKFSSKWSNYKLTRLVLYDPAMLHTSFARLLGQPKIPSEDKYQQSNQLRFFHELVTRLNNQIRRVEAVVSELWYVEEFDVLALALNGRMKERKFKLCCSRS